MKKFLKNAVALRQRGFGMIETIMVLALAAGFIIGGLVLFGNAQLSNNTTDAQRAMVQISSETRAMFRTATDFTNATEADLIAAKAVSQNLIDPGPTAAITDDTIMLPYDGAVDVAVGTDPQTFVVTVTWTGATSKAQALCQRLIAETDSSGMGPLGTDYAVTDDDCTAANAMLEATYKR